MSWLDDFLKAPQPTRTRRPRNVGWVGADVLPGTEEYLQLDGREELAQKATLRLPSTFLAASNIAKICAQCDPHVGRQAGPDEKPQSIKDHPLERMFWRPNPWMSNVFVWWFTYMALPIRGEAYLYFEDGKFANASARTGDVFEIWPMPPWRVKPIPTKDTRTFVRGYNYWPETGAEPIFIPPENVCWIRQPNLTDLYAGLSTVSAAHEAISTSVNQWDFRKNYFGKRRGRPETLLGVKKDMSVTDFERLKHELLTQFQVVDRGTLIHRMGDIDVKILGMSADDMQLMEFQDHDAKVLQQLFGWNTSLNEATSYAQADVARDVMIQTGAWPLMSLVAGDLSSQILRKRYGDDLVVYYDDIRPERKEEDRADYETYGQDQTINEGRKKRGDEPITAGPMAEVCETVPKRLLPFYFQAQGAAPPVEPSESLKADLARWQRKALRVLEESGTAAAEFESEHIPELAANRIKGALTFADTPDEVKGIFQCVLTPSQPIPS